MQLGDTYLLDLLPKLLVVRRLQRGLQAAPSKLRDLRKNLLRSHMPLN